MQPGCKADCVLILEALQGKGKSTGVKILAGEWFADEIADLGTKDAAMQTRGVWILELAELDAMSRAEASKIKAFVSRGTDHFRPPYGRRIIDLPRQCVFAGTVNHSAYLKDETGGRRFWPVACGTIDVEALAHDRDQLWAEARVRYEDGEPWWIDSDELTRDAEAVQAMRYDSDVWDPLILEWAQSRIDSGCESVAIGEVLELCLGKKSDHWTRGDEIRVGRCLSANKWERYRDRKQGMQWRYRPVVPR
jgi:predicted P-loop ATPase